MTIIVNGKKFNDLSAVCSYFEIAENKLLMELLKADTFERAVNNVLENTKLKMTNTLREVLTAKRLVVNGKNFNSFEEVVKFYGVDKESTLKRMGKDAENLNNVILSSLADNYEMIFYTDIGLSALKRIKPLEEETNAVEESTESVNNEAILNLTNIDLNPTFNYVYENIDELITGFGLNEEKFKSFITNSSEKELPKILDNYLKHFGVDSRSDLIKNHCKVLDIKVGALNNTMKKDNLNLDDAVSLIDQKRQEKEKKKLAKSAKSAKVESTTANKKINLEPITTEPTVVSEEISEELPEVITETEVTTETVEAVEITTIDENKQYVEKSETIEPIYAKEENVSSIDKKVIVEHITNNHLLKKANSDVILAKQMELIKNSQLVLVNGIYYVCYAEAYKKLNIDKTIVKTIKDKFMISESEAILMYMVEFGKSEPTNTVQLNGLTFSNEIVMVNSVGMDMIDVYKQCVENEKSIQEVCINHIANLI